MNEALGLAIGLGRIGLGADVLEAEALAGLLESEGFIARAVVGHDALDRHAQARIVGEGSLEEGNGASPFLVLHDLAKGDPGSIVDTDMDVFPAWPLAARTLVALSMSIAGDAMADPIELTELFDVDVNQLTWALALIAADRLGRLQG